MAWDIAYQVRQRRRLLPVVWFFVESTSGYAVIQDLTASGLSSIPERQHCRFTTLFDHMYLHLKGEEGRSLNCGINKTSLFVNIHLTRIPRRAYTCTINYTLHKDNEGRHYESTKTTGRMAISRGSGRTLYGSSAGTARGGRPRR